MNKLIFILSLILVLLIPNAADAKKKKYPNGDYYEGGWKKGQPNGIGTMYYFNGDKYSGNWNMGRKSGKGMMIYKNGDVYTGLWDEDNYHGIGKLIQKDSVIFEGVWSSGEFDRGKQTNSNGDIFKGKWKHGTLYSGTSKGYINNTFYDGLWREGKFYEGIGIGNLTDSLWCNWEIKDGKIIRFKGKCKGYINGDYYDGEWINDFFTGTCKLKDINKDIVSFEGTISVDTIMKGKFLYKNGYLYTGKLKNYLREGKGKMSSNDITISGMWEKGILINGVGNIQDMAENYSFNINRISGNYDIQVKNSFGDQVQLKYATVNTDEDLVSKIQNIVRNQLYQQTIKQRQLVLEKQERAEEARMQSKLKNYRGENYGIGKMKVTPVGAPEIVFLYKFGDAEFQYYPTTRKDILYGNFHVWNGRYWGNDESFAGKILYSAQGKFKNGVKTGTWIFEERDKRGEHLKRRLTINYRDGKKSGLSTLETYGERGSYGIIKAYYNNDQWEKRGTTYYYYNKSVYESWFSTAINTNIVERRINFDNSGNLHGDIYIRMNDIELKEKYEHGKLITSEKRNIRKGIVLSPKRGENRFNEMWKLILPAAYPLGGYIKHSYRVDNDALIGLTFMNFEEGSELNQRLVDKLKEESNK
ncbi:hypothetical protein [uncultured Phocaeicola sp.]|uniref:hypothetical protein n=1 Tax=uncultured Phocaeicola sp. TaxID=990718 RepID=UPI0025920D47|nr:hypothetical protein [uncultured Phocaeicola sp.]